MSRKRLILASSSSYRRAMLARLGIPFETISPDVDEAARPGESPAALATRLSIAKARTIAARHPDAVVIGSDQVASADGLRPIGKPMTRAAATAQLREASGRELVFHSGLAVTCGASGYERVACVDTRVGYRTLDDEAIAAYLDAEHALDCAGAARSEGLGIALLAYVRSDDPTALVGLPLIELTSMLAEAGLAPLARSSAGAAPFHAQDAAARNHAGDRN